MPPARRRSGAAGRGGGVAGTHSIEQVVQAATIAPVVVLVGDEELLVSRAAQAVVTAVRATEPGVEQVERPGGQVEATEIADLLSPSLFGERRVIVVPAAQDVRAEAWRVMAPFVADPDPSITLVLEHAGGAKGKAVLEAAVAAKAPVVVCAAPRWPEQLAAFVRAEVRAGGGDITQDAAAALVEAVGSDLRELASVADQLRSDCEGRIDTSHVAAYHRGRAQVHGWDIADLAVVGEESRAIEATRWALSIGTAPVVLADALADGVRSIAKVMDLAPNARAYDVAARLGMAPRKVETASRQARRWKPGAVDHALQVVARLNADVKGEAVDPGYALEAAVREVARLSGVRA